MSKKSIRMMRNNVLIFILFSFYFWLMYPISVISEFLWLIAGAYVQDYSYQTLFVYFMVSFISLFFTGNTIILLSKIEKIWDK